MQESKADGTLTYATDPKEISKLEMVHPRVRTGISTWRMDIEGEKQVLEGKFHLKAGDFQLPP